MLWLPLIDKVIGHLRSPCNQRIIMLALSTLLALSLLSPVTQSLLPFSEHEGVVVVFRSDARSTLMTGRNVQTVLRRLV